MTESEQYRALILDNIEYDLLRQDAGSDADDLDEIVEIIVEMVCARRKYTRVSSSTFPHEVVKTRLLKLNSEHIRFVMQCMRENTTQIRNIKQYLLAVLFNAPIKVHPDGMGALKKRSSVHRKNTWWMEHQTSYGRRI